MKYSHNTWTKNGGRPGSLVIAVIIIGLITFAFSYVGFYIGKSFGHFFETGIEAIGGFILIGNE